MNIIQTMTLAANQNIVMIVVLVVLMIGMFAMSIIPQKKQKKKAQEMVDSITVGTKVKTIGGFVGEVKKVDVANNLFILDISANNDGSALVSIDRSAIFMILEAVKTSEGEVKLQEKPEVAAMDDMEADKASKEKKAAKKANQTDAGDSLEKTDSETLLKD